MFDYLYLYCYLIFVFSLLYYFQLKLCLYDIINYDYIIIISVLHYVLHVYSILKQNGPLIYINLGWILIYSTISIIDNNIDYILVSLFVICLIFNDQINFFIVYLHLKLYLCPEKCFY